jgi:hypothetical protein
MIASSHPLTRVIHQRGPEGLAGVAYEPHRTLADLRRKFVRRLAHTGSPSQELEPPKDPARFSSKGTDDALQITVRSSLLGLAYVYD